MCTKCRSILLACLLVVFRQPAAMPAPDTHAQAQDTHACHSHLHSLITNLREAAQLEGMHAAVEWHRSGWVAVQFDGPPRQERNTPGQ